MATLLARYRPVEAKPLPVTTTSSPSACSNCGTPYPLGIGSDKASTDAQKRITELESQVRLLTEKATAAADKLADCEDELRRLRAAPQDQKAIVGTRNNSVSGIASSSETNLPATTDSAEPSLAALAPTKPAANTTTGRFAALLASARGASPTLSTGSTSSRPPSVREAELEEALQRELAARRQAETKVTQMSGELEELSVQLFQQANEMVASERRARAKLEERVQVLETRDGEKRKRLDRLEGAIRRIERVHGLLKG